MARIDDTGLRVLTPFLRLIFLDFYGCHGRCQNLPTTTNSLRMTANTTVRKSVENTGLRGVNFTVVHVTLLTCESALWAGVKFLFISASFSLC